MIARETTDCKPERHGEIDRNPMTRAVFSLVPTREQVFLMLV
jgi:hypothetical protein